MKTLAKITTIMLLVCLLSLLLCAACGDGDDEETPITTATPTATPTEPPDKVKITIGNHTDMTGPAAQAMAIVDMGLVDIVRYYNDNNLISGVEVIVESYDGMMDPSRDIPGWKWLEERGADVIMAWLPAISTSLQSIADREQIPLFVANTLSELIEVPGYMFASSVLYEDLTWTLVNWVIDNDWDWQTKGPAKIGAALDEGSNPTPVFNTFKKYAEMYPERMEWVGGYTTQMGLFTWTNEVVALKDCDYIYLPNIFPFFVKDYVNSGYDKAKFLTTDNHTSFIALLDDMGYWPDIDGMINITQSEWWTEDAEYSNFARELANTYRSDMISKIEMNPKGYNSFANGVHVLETIKLAAETVGPENVDSQAIFEAAEKLTLEFDGIQRFSFSETKRTSPDRLAVYEADSANKGFVRLSEWFPIESPPE